MEDETANLRLAEADPQKLLYRLVIRQLQDDGHTEAADAVRKATGAVSDLTLENYKLAGIVKNFYSDVSEAQADLVAETTDIGDEAVEEGKEKEEMKVEKKKEENLTFPAYKMRFITSHKGLCLAGAFSADGRFAATGSVDSSIKLLDVAKMHFHSQSKTDRTEYAASRPVVRTFYDHVGAVTDLAFHPSQPFLISCARDETIKFFDCGKRNLKRSYRSIRDAAPLSSICLHPSGDFLLAASAHPFVRVYDVNTFQAYVCADPSMHHGGPVTQVRFAPNVSLFASSSDDGTVKLWDTVSNRCVRTIERAHQGSAVSSAVFSNDGKYLLSSGQDSTIRLWELTTGKQVHYYPHSKHDRLHVQAVFEHSGDFILSSDERSADVVAWDTRTGEVVQRLSGHNRVSTCIAVSPTEPAFISCSDDHRARFFAVGE